MKRRRRRGDKPALRQEWAAEHESCACCGIRWREFGADLHTHHILGGAYGRPDDVRNFLRLCRGCHDLAHAGKLTRAMQLMLKIETDSENYDRDWLSSKMGNRRLESPEPIPEELRKR